MPSTVLTSLSRAAASVEPSIWGTVPQWVTGVGTLVAFAWAVFLYRRSVLDRELEAPRRVTVSVERRWFFEQGTAVSRRFEYVAKGKRHMLVLDMDPIDYELSTLLTDEQLDGQLRAAYPLTVLAVRVSNHSSEGVSDVIVGPSVSAGLFSHVSLEALEPEESERVLFVVSHSQSDGVVRVYSDDVSVSFMDSGGERWMRTGQRPVERLRLDIRSIEFIDWQRESYVRRRRLYYRLRTPFVYGVMLLGPAGRRGRRARRSTRKPE